MKYNFTKLLLSGGAVTPQYNFDLFLDNDWNTFFYSHGQTKTSIPYTPNKSNSTYANVLDLENSDLYRAFTDYVINNWDPTTKTFKDHRVYDYLLALERSTTGSGHKAILFNNGLLVSNWQPLYRKYRNDQKWGYYHEGPNGPSTTPKDNQITIPEPNPNPRPLPKLIPPQPPKRTPWTDPYALGAELGTGLAGIEEQTELAKRKKFPLIEGPFLQHKVTNNYHLRSGMEQNANELRDLAAFRSNSADLQENLDNLRKYDTQALDVENQAELIKANTVLEELLKLENTINQNKQTASEVANYNTKSNAAALNNILDANIARSAKRTELFLDFIDKMTTSHGLKLKDDRLNHRYWQRGVNKWLSGLDRQLLQNEFLKNSDFENSSAYRDFVSAVDSSKGNQIEGFDSNRYSTDRDQYLRELWQSHSFASPYKSAWDKEYKTYYQDYLNRLYNIQNQYEASDLMLPLIINNLGFSFLDDYNSTHTYVPTSFLKGGKVHARMIDYYKHLQKALEEDKKASQKRSLERNKLLNADLDRLSKEQLILLRSIFK